MPRRWLRLSIRLGNEVVTYAVSNDAAMIEAYRLGLWSRVPVWIEVAR